MRKMIKSYINAQPNRIAAHTTSRVVRKMIKTYINAQPNRIASHTANRLIRKMIMYSHSKRYIVCAIHIQVVYMICSYI